MGKLNQTQELLQRQKKIMFKTFRRVKFSVSGNATEESERVPRGRRLILERRGPSRSDGCPLAVILNIMFYQP